MKKNIKAVLGIAVLSTVMWAAVACGSTPVVITPTPTGAATNTPAATSTSAPTEATAPTETPATPTEEPTPTEAPTSTPTPTPAGVQNPTTEISEETLAQFNAIDFFKDVEWCGDSLMNFYQWRGAQYVDPTNFGSYKASTWLTLNSYAVRYAIKDEITDYDPKYNGAQVKLWDAIPKTGKTRIVMFFGTNDIGVTGVDKFIENYKALIDRIKTTGDYKFYILSMTPMRKDKQSTTGGLSNPLIDEANAALKKMCAENGYGFVDVATPLKDSEGNLNLEYSDGTNVHIVKEGYKFWDAALIKYAKEQLYLESLGK